MYNITDQEGGIEEVKKLDKDTMARLLWTLKMIWKGFLQHLFNFILAAKFALAMILLGDVN